MSTTTTTTTSTVKKGLAKTPRLDGSKLNIIIVRTLWNKEIIDALTTGCIEELHQSGVKRVKVVEVPGAFELPLACKKLIASSQEPIDAVVAIGCLIKGDTPHFEYICGATSQGLMDVGLNTGVPIIFGVLTVLTVEQAEIRAGLKPGMHNHGPEWAAAAIRMSHLD